MDHGYLSYSIPCYSTSPTSQFNIRKACGSLDSTDFVCGSTYLLLPISGVPASDPSEETEVLGGEACYIWILKTCKKACHWKAYEG